jgi:hypothetical protein
MKDLSPKIVPFGFAQGAISSCLSGAVARFQQGGQRGILFVGNHLTGRTGIPDSF